MNTYFNHVSYSDINPYELVRIISEKCVVIKAMKATQINKEKLTFVAGGFVAHCANQHEQEWKIESMPNAKEFRIRLHKDGVWRDTGGDRYKPSDKPVKYYDFNF